MKSLLVLSAVLSLVPAVSPGSSDESTSSHATLFSGLGSHSHPIRTASSEAQKFFDQGLTLLYGFNHEEAIRAFQRAAELDADAAMPHWGIALALGSNYNDPQPAEERLKKAFAESQRAHALAANGPSVERAYAEALAKRYSDDPRASPAILARQYHAAMGEVARRFPDDLDAATLWAEAGMNLNPWKLWKPDGTPAEGTPEILATLEGVLKRDPNHPGANHYYIHAVEASPAPERALPSAMRLPALVPGAGHLVHMPAHIYMRTGDYVAAAEANAKAADVDESYLRASPGGANAMYRMMYYDHNLHFQSAAAAMAGRHAEAKKAAELLSDGVLPVVAMDPMLEGYVVQPLVVAVRFRDWSAVRTTPDPGPKTPAVRVFWLYARAAAAPGSADRAAVDRARADFRGALDAIPEDRHIGPMNTVRAVLAVAAHDLDARIAEARGNRKAAIASWMKAVAAEDALAYDEPPAWQQPMRESLGAALLRDGRPQEAEKVFREDLDRNPRNGRSLFGLAAALEAMKRPADAAFVRERFEVSWRDADTKLRLEDL